ANTIGMVIERKRRDGERDGLLWFCENCNEKLYEEYFDLEDITTQFQGVFKRFYDDENLRTCKNCETVMQPPPVVS
nr:3-hydroxyanthranilate 3,4-dioxygenase [Acidobacteriota bacterium]